MPSCLQCSAAIPPALSLSERRSHATRILRPGGLCTTSPPACPDAGKAAGRESVFFSFSGAPSFTFSAKGGLLFLTFRFVAAPFRLCSVTTCFQPCRIAVFVNILLSRVSSARSIRSSRSSVDSDRRKQSIIHSASSHYPAPLCRFRRTPSIPHVSPARVAKKIENKNSSGMWSRFAPKYLHAATPCPGAYHVASAKLII